MSKRKAKKTIRPEMALVAPVPEGRERQRVLWFVAAFLLINLVIPLRWYLGWGDDERFCWRMFSSNSLQRVSLSMRETVDGAERRVPAQTVMQPAWNEFLHKYRQPAAFQGMLERHCALSDAESARSCGPRPGRTGRRSSRRSFGSRQRSSEPQGPFLESPRPGDIPPLSGYHAGLCGVLDSE